ncbi:Ferredoxin subunit of nitrite reductase or a ring-hydroxylating dioxygenase [Nocardioides scoriae]|uniref:Cytochrome bc1 complex Rieske iron-sulfur subunit n=1 Tax=Nocardioides scoriae TaxID=642780 RepID=A0A1H1N5Y2_9ACTN|nr:Rieske (2Fe-2S) protein [Nocardioides scoriae]SDR94327.1 Ferredoxin subunit of nitrite reductase or a ring-hydroxylating dioxygenase [Nocardioides scoriae]
MAPSDPTPSRSASPTAATQASGPRRRTTSRRALVGGALGLGVGVPLVAACGSDDEASGSGSGTSTTSSGPVTTTSDVPVGGGVILAAEKIVVTQPTESEFKAFSAVCPHQKCLVSKIEGEDIDCECHGSKFSITDGSVVNGPAEQPLSALTVKVDGQDISVT